MMRVALLGALAMFSGCALQTPPTQDETLAQALPAQTVVPAKWSADADTVEPADGWLKDFNDPALDAIVREAIVNNLDLRQAAADVAIAQQTAIVVGARLLPSVAGQLGAKGTRDDDHDTTFTSQTASVGASWEIDVWGALRAQRAAAQADAQATALSYAWARQSLVGTTAITWYLAVETKQLLALADSAVRIYSELLRLVQLRRNAGKDSDLDVVDVRAKLESAQSVALSVRSDFESVGRALEILLGRYPSGEIAIATADPALVQLSGAGVPSLLLARRPDLVAAQGQVLAAFRGREAAELALLPQFVFSLAGGRVDDGALSHLHLNPWLGSAAIGMSIPLYEGGALRAQIEIATAQQAQAISRYGSVVLQAFREVEIGLANERLLAQRLPLDQSALDDMSEAVRIATIQYKTGRRDLLWVAQLQSVQLAGAAQLIRLRGAQRVNRIRLQQALGSSFDDRPAVATAR